MELKKYSDIINYLNKKKRAKHLLLGNGFSMAYDKAIFSYNALSDFLLKTDNKFLKKLFDIIKTYNFEQIMRELDVFCALATEFSKDQNLASTIKAASESLKKNLIDAVSQLHPEHIFKIPQNRINLCATFLKEYLDNDGHVFTTNYDLLLYWVLMSSQDGIANIIDGFGREYFINDEDDKNAEAEAGDLEWGNNRTEQHVHYLHGALHLFDSGTAISKEIYDGNYLLKNIKTRMENKEYPVFVTAGDGEQKLSHILHNQYLDFCYKKLSSIEGSLITFGFNFGDYDKHIIDAINKASKQDIDSKLWSVYIGVYSEKDIKHIKSIHSSFKCKVNLFDAKSVNIWGVEL